MVNQGINEANHRDNNSNDILITRTRMKIGNNNANTNEQYINNI